MTTADRRRGSRLETQMRICVAGVDDFSQLRRGNLSAKGIYFEVQEDLGAPGTVVALRASTADGQRTIDLLAAVVRVVAAEDLIHGRQVAGVALEFMPDGPETRRDVDAMLRHVAAFAVDAESQGHPIVAEIERQLAEPVMAVVRSMAPGRLLGAAPWAPEEGSSVRGVIHVRAARREIYFNGAVTAVRLVEDAPADQRYALDIEVHWTSPTPPDSRIKVRGSSVGDAIQTLLGQALRAEVPGSLALRAGRLHGEVGPVPLARLLRFLSWHEVSGVVAASLRTGEVRVFLRGGNVVDVHDGAGGRGRELLATAVGANSGTFEVIRQPVELPDRVGISTPRLLEELSGRTTAPLAAR